MRNKKNILKFRYIQMICFILFGIIVIQLDWKLVYNTSLLYSTSDDSDMKNDTMPWNKQKVQGRTLSLELNYQEMSLLCNQTNDIITSVRNRALLSKNEREVSRWDPNATFQLLTCDQLMRSLPLTMLKRGMSTTKHSSSSGIGGRFHPNIERYDITVSNTSSSSFYDHDNISFEIRNLISLQRLAEKLSKPSFTIVVIGGSVTTGVRDFPEDDDDDDNDDKVEEDGDDDDDYYDDDGYYYDDTFNIAFPKKLEDFLQYQWKNTEIKVINIAEGGADEDTWLGKLDQIMEFDPDIILVESAVNDQCDYDEQDEQFEYVNRTSFSLLNLLMNLPQHPAVISVEFFRTAYKDEEDAESHCDEYVEELTSDPECFYCPQWWKPQTWRQEARTYNSVSHASYRDAVWPILEKPPEKLCSEYWNGLSHPQIGVHVMMASTILFQFLVVMEKRNVLLQLSSEREKQERLQNRTDGGLKMIDPPRNICFNHITAYRAVQGNANDPFGSDSRYSDLCWSFRADVRNKYGWVCEVMNNTDPIGDEYLHLSKKIHIGGDRKLIISRLVSYDDRMATARVWLTGSSTNHGSTNVFVGDPVWDIPSWHGKRTSIPQPYAIQLGKLKFKRSVKMQWPTRDSPLVGAGTNDEESSTVEVTFNIKVLIGTSRSVSDPKVDKFKLLGIVTC